MITMVAAKGILAAVGKRIPLRWVVLASIAAPLCFLAAKYIDAIFSVARWAQIGSAVAVCGAIVWELACLYYTGSFDVPGDGKKPAWR